MVYDPASNWRDAHPIKDDRDVSEAFRRQPFGQHSPALQRILIKMRAQSMSGKYALLVRERHKEWVLVRMTGSATEPIEIIEEHVFTSLEEAEWFVFEERWREYTEGE